jgi:hypothetical protein
MINDNYLKLNTIMDEVGSELARLSDDNIAARKTSSLSLDSTTGIFGTDTVASPDSSSFMSPVATLVDNFVGNVQSNPACQQDELLAMTFNYSPSGSTRSNVKKLNLLETTVTLSMQNEENETYDGYDTEVANSGEKQTDEEIKIAKSNIDRTESEVIKIAFWHSKTKQWLFRWAQRLKTFTHPTKEVTADELLEWGAKYDTHGKNVRPLNQRVPITLPGDAKGIFQYCACQMRNCKVNVATSVHCCRKCKRRMHGYCLVNPGQFGICKTCYFDWTENYTFPNKKFDDNNNVKPKTSRPPIIKKPINMMKGSEIVALATKRSAKMISTPAEDNDSSDDDSIDEAQQSMGRAYLDMEHEDVNFFKVVLNKGILEPPKSKVMYVLYCITC